MDTEFCESEDRTAEQIENEDSGLFDVPKIPVKDRAMRDFSCADKEQCLITIERKIQMDDSDDGDDQERARLEL